MRLFVCLLIFALPCFAADDAELLALARAAVKAEVLGQKPPSPQKSDKARAVFVTIERKNQVLGCRGSLRAREGSLQREVIQAARVAASHDPRYRPLTPANLKDFLVTVTVVQSISPLNLGEIGGLSPGDGLVLQSGQKFGIVLPWEGKNARVRLGWAYKKAGVPVGAAVRLFRLKAERMRR